MIKFLARKPKFTPVGVYPYWNNPLSMVLVSCADCPAEVPSSPEFKYGFVVPCVLILVLRH